MDLPGGGGTREVRVVIADDHELYRDQLRLTLDEQDDLVVVGAALDGEGALELIERLRPDVALVDLRMPAVDGLELCRLTAGNGVTRVVLLTAFLEPELVACAQRAGAAGYLGKGAAGDEICAALRRVAGGERVFARAAG